MTEASTASEGGDTLLDLKSLTNDPTDWNNSQSTDALELVVEEPLLRAWAKTGVWAPDNLWLCKVMPLWEAFVEKAAPKELMFSLQCVERTLGAPRLRRWGTRSCWP